MNLQKLNLSSHLRILRQNGRKLGIEFDYVHEDMYLLWKYLFESKGLFESTPVIDNIDPLKYGASGATLLVNPSVSQRSQIFDSSKSRSKTIAESIDELYTVVGGKLDSDSAVELNNIKFKVGLNRFDSTKSSSDTSIDADISKLYSRVDQIAADCFNTNNNIDDPLDGNDYAFNDASVQTISESLRDQINTLFELHGGKSAPGHYGIGTKSTWTSVGNMTFWGYSTNYVAPFSNNISDNTEDARFYNPNPNTMKVSNLTVRASNNTLNGPAKIEVMKNGVSELEVSIPLGSTDVHMNLVDSFNVNQGDYIQFRITTDVGTQITVNSIALTVEELIEI